MIGQMVGGMLCNVRPGNLTTQLVISCDIFKLWLNSGQQIGKTYISLWTYIATELPSDDTIGGPTHFQVVVNIAHHHIPAVHDYPLPLSYLEVQYNQLNLSAMSQDLPILNLHYKSTILFSPFLCSLWVAKKLRPSVSYLTDNQQTDRVIIIYSYHV